MIVVKEGNPAVSIHNFQMICHSHSIVIDCTNCIVMTDDYHHLNYHDSSNSELPVLDTIFHSVMNLYLALGFQALYNAYYAGYELRGIEIAALRYSDQF